MLLTVLLRLNNACEEQDFHLLYQVFHRWLRLVLVPETPCNSISSVSHTVSRLKYTYDVWHIAQEHINLMNSRTSTMTHFVEHSTRLYDCKSYILNSIYKRVTENDFFFCLFHTYKLSFVFLQAVERQRAQDASVRNIFRSLFLAIFVSKQRISLLINPYDSPHRK